MGTVRVTVPTVPDPPLGGTVGTGTVTQPSQPSTAPGDSVNVNDIVAVRIQAARWKAAQQQRRRADLAAARQRGLTARHAQKLRNLNPIKATS